MLISKELQEKVIRACNELGYFPETRVGLLSYDEAKIWINKWKQTLEYCECEEDEAV